jgi:hypothetical protein
MGDGETSTIYAAGLQGIKLAIQIADEVIGKRHTREKLVIFTDNQAAIRTFRADRQIGCIHFYGRDMTD